MIVFCLVATVLLFFCGCSESERQDVPIVSVEIDDSSMGYADSVWREGRQVFLETTAESALNQLSKIIVWNDRVFILDDPSDKICVFDTTGKFLWRIQRLGRGPGEYLGLADFLVDPQEQEILLYADRPYKLIRFDLNGNYKSETQMPDALFYELAMCDRQLVGIIAEQSDTENYLALLDAKDGIVTEHVALDRKLPCSIFSTGRQLLRSLHLNFTCRYDNTIYRLEEGRVVPQVCMDFGKNNFPQSMLDDQMTVEQFDEEVMSKYIIFSITNVTEDEERFYFTTNIGGSVGIVTKESLQAQYFRQMMDKGLHIPLGVMLPVESLGRPMVGFQQTPSQLKIMVEIYGTKVEPRLRDRIKAAQEDDNPVLFLYQN